jgi:lipopolysaccharide export system protein LptA
VHVTQSVAQVARRKKLTVGVVAGALAITLITIAVTYWRGRSRQEKAVRPPQSLPSNVHQQLSGYTFTRSDEGRQVFTVHAARTVAFKQGGATVLEDVYVEVFGKTGGRRDLMRTRRCDYNQQSGDLFSSGKTQIELNAPPADQRPSAPDHQKSVQLETSRLYFRQRGSLVTSDQPVQYRFGAVSGTARGMRYATREGSLDLSKDVRAELQLTGARLPLQLTAARAVYMKEKGEIYLTGPVEVLQGTRRGLAANGIVSLDGDNRITRAVFEGGARLVDSSEAGKITASARTIRGDFDPPSHELRTVLAEGNVRFQSQHAGSVTRLAAPQLELSFLGERTEPQRGTASRGVRIEVESPSAIAAKPDARPAPGNPGVERKLLTADAVRFSFQSQGKSLKDSETVGPGRLVVTPSDPKVGTRVITAGQFLMAFNTRNQLETLRGISGTRIVFQPPKNAPRGSIAQVSTAEHLEADLDTASQTIRTVRQWGDFRFREGDRQGKADQATYQAGTEAMTLTGRPELWDAEMRTRAEQVVIDLRTDSAEGTGKVQSTHLGSAAGATSVLADRVVAQRNSQTAHYEGNVRAWRGTDVVESASLDVYRRERRVKSGYQVRTSHLQPASLMAADAAPGEKREARPVTIRADRLEYFDQGRKASYRGNVKLLTEATTLEADSLDAFFSDSPGGEATELERALAEGHVRVTQPARRANGDHGEYYAQDGKIILTGGPPTLHDADKGFTTGRRLTFYIRDDRLQVDGGDESPTLSKHRIAQ